MSFENIRLCVICKHKEPSVDTVLEPNVNISEGRWNRSDYTCDSCYKERQKHYQNRERFSDYWHHLKEETIEEFMQEWNDPAYRKVKEIADRVRKVWDKYERRTPAKGIRRDWICEVIFPELWHIDANGIVEDWFQSNKKTKGQQITAKPHLLEFVSNGNVLALLEAAYKDKARGRWNTIVDTIVRKYAGIEKMVASPPYIDPITKDKIDNWYLLSREQERETREAKTNERILGLKRAIDQEHRVIEYQEDKIEKRHEHEEKKNSESKLNNQKLNEGGELR